MTPPCVFLSYARSDLAYARTLHDRLEAARLTVWWDQEEPPGEDWTEQLLAWLEGAHAVVVIVSRDSAVAPSVKNEVLLAQDYHRRVIPVLLEQARGGLWLLIRSLQWIDARDGRDPVPALLEALRAAPPPALPDPTDEALAMDDVMARYAPPPASLVQAQVTITLPGDIRDFSDRERSGLIQIIARFARLRPDQIKIVRVEAGSVLVTLQLPESSARWLVTLYERQAPLIDLLDIHAVRDLRVLPAPNSAVEPPAAAPEVVEWLGAWLRGWTRRSVLAGALAALLLVAALTMTLRAPAPPDGTLVGMVVAVQGTLELRSVGWNAFVPVAAGAHLQAGDRLRLEPGAQARVVCADGTLIEVQAGNAPVPCQSQAERLFDIARVPWANAVLSAGDAALPRVIMPRATALLTTMPAVRWTAVDGTDSYTVILYREGEELWRETAQDTTTLPYPADQPPLEPGPIYRFAVTVEDGPEEIAQGSGVQVLDAQQGQAIRAEARQIEQLDVDDAIRFLLLANLYASHGLYAEALVLLESPEDPSAQPALFQLRGDIYLAVGLPELAIAPYTRALEAAARAGDQPAQARANRMLGTVYSRLGGEINRARAVAHFQQALRFAEEVGDVEAQKELRQLLADLA
ncbi:MAG: hypothetical protein OHK0015_06020 [Chloroflexi bacterium OHK40]